MTPLWNLIADVAYSVVSDVKNQADTLFESVLFSPEINVTDCMCLKVLVTLQPFVTLSVHTYGTFNTTLFQSPWMPSVKMDWIQVSAGLILGLRPANGRRRYSVTTSLIDWAQA